MIKNENNITAEEILEMCKDTSEIFASKVTNNFISGMAAYKTSEALVNEVEFWQWLKANFPKKLTDVETIKTLFTEKPEWIKNIQGKGYEWDYVNYLRGKFGNFFSKFELGTNPTQKGVDIVEKGFFNEKIKNTFQNKAYYGKANPDLSNTPKTAIVITNSEKVEYSRNKGYKTEGFMNAEEGKKTAEKRFEDAKVGNINFDYNWKNISMTMGKAGIMGGALGLGLETIFSYRRFKNGEITKEEYFKEILKTGGSSAVVSAGTAGIMIPVAAKITVLGMTKLINIPASIAISATLNKIVAPAFGKGEYKKILSEAKYYNDVNNAYQDIVKVMLISFNEYENFIEEAVAYEKERIQLSEETDNLREKNKNIDSALEKLYSSI
ncbi:hypothetical protein [Fusobacterium sp.]|uniref:hypothetical protein n=1 Tax=Fusobacterium sp. TaxID=68766 RepID=UPI0028FED878|nr:hypothetical protein [Fusobacterium sp.]MDU1911936.1 hypothetical protein [Fusobacterium sp.]